MLALRTANSATQPAARRSASQARATSASVVRMFPTASRSTVLPPRTIGDMNASPERLTASAIRSFSSSLPSRRKHTTENGRGATTSQPGSARTHSSKHGRETDVLADPVLQPLGAVAADAPPRA